MKKPILSIPNFSEGRNKKTIRAIANAAQNAGVRILDCSADPDHNRMVLACEGSPNSIFAGIIASARTAVELIDLNKHSGEHPRLGAIDVVPFIPMTPEDEKSAINLSLRTGRALATELNLPVYLYEKSAKRYRTSDLPTLRKGGFEAWKNVTLDNEKRPDFGPNKLHPTAGAVIVGVRNPLLAFNVVLNTADMKIAEAIASDIRKKRLNNPALAGLRAIAVNLKSRKLTQVSFNIIEPDKISMIDACNLTEQLAKEYNASVLETELIGIARTADLIKGINQAIHCNIKANQIIDY